MAACKVFAKPRFVAPQKDFPYAPTTLQENCGITLNIRFDLQKRQCGFAAFAICP
jgi:hypothetical protein